jgi:phosphatidylserine/phosphatidylglycerophosphate/cardiolipin synthase-like enzyme
VTVAGVFDESQAAGNTGTEWDRLREAGLDVRMDGNSSLMHHKVILIDGETIVTGSYNFSANAERRNDENTLVIYSSRVASQYMVEFERVFEEGQR